MNRFKVGVIQLDSQDDLSKNLNKIENFVIEASDCGCEVVALAENSNYVGLDASGFAEDIPGGRTFEFLSELAKSQGIWIHSGSIYERISDDKRSYNTSFVISPKGELMCKFRKLHPFDVSIKDGPDVRESDRIKPGDEICVLDTKDFGIWGFSICYDMRFPEIFRLMALSGAKLMFVPADFTINTGKDHWEVLLRARAIENGSYVIAPAQIGIKPRFQAYGKSLIVDPWGNVIAKASDRECLITAEIDLDYADQIRDQVGTLKNRRSDVYEIKKL